LSDAGTAIAFIYCDYKDRAAQTLPELVASLLKQFIQRRPTISQSAWSLYCEHYPQATRPNLGELREKLRKQVEEYSKIFVIIDGLDELVEQHRHRLIKEVQSMANTVKLMVTSRSLPSIEQIFLGKQRILDICASEQDVKKYVKDRIDNMDGPHASIFKGVENICDKIVTKIQGMYVCPFSFVTYHSLC
jgi:hypothetical protein